MKLFITGGTGFLGSVLIEKLLCSDKIEKIYVLTHKAKLSTESSRIQTISGDVRNLHEILINDDIDTCIMLSGAINGRAINGRAINGRTTRDINYNGTESAIKFCRKNNIARIIFTSSVNARLPKRGVYGQSKLDSEKLIANSGLDYIIFRPSLIYGRKCKFGLNVIEKCIRKYGVVPVFGNGKKLEQPIHVDECAELIKFYTLNQSVTSGRIIELLGRDAMTYNDMCRVIAECINKPVRLIHVPAWPFAWGLKLIESLNIGLPVSSEQIYHVDTDLAGDMSGIYSETWITAKSFRENFLRDGICGE